MKRMLTIASILLMASCAMQYVPPTGPDKAVLVLPTKESSWHLLGGFSGASVTFAVKGDDGCGTINKLIEPKKAGDATVEVEIPGNKDIFVVFNTNIGNMACNVTGSFRALPNFKYEVVNLGGGYKCMLGVVQVAQDQTRTPIKLDRAYPDAWTGFKICDKN